MEMTVAQKRQQLVKGLLGHAETVMSAWGDDEPEALWEDELFVAVQLARTRLIAGLEAK